MYISGLIKNKLKEFNQLLDTYDISFEVWDEETGDTFTLFIPKTDNIRIYLGGAFDDISIMINGETKDYIALYKGDYYQIVW